MGASESEWLFPDREADYRSIEAALQQDKAILSDFQFCWSPAGHSFPDFMPEDVEP